MPGGDNGSACGKKGYKAVEIESCSSAASGYQEHAYGTLPEFDQCHPGRCRVEVGSKGPNVFWAFWEKMDCSGHSEGSLASAGMFLYLPSSISKE
jgi:hypothetical protein